MSKIKICGLFRPVDIEYVNLALPDYIGFVIDFPQSHRSIASCEVLKLKSKLDKRIQAVGVFVDAPLEVIKNLCDIDAIDMIQLHGHEDNTYIKELKAITDKEIIKAFIVDENFMLQSAEDSLSDWVLFDGGRGNGKMFPYHIIEKINRPFFLAGGIALENIPDVLQLVKPYGLDISTGVETDKQKDLEKICMAVISAHREV